MPEVEVYLGRVLYQVPIRVPTYWYNGCRYVGYVHRTGVYCYLVHQLHTGFISMVEIAILLGLLKKRNGGYGKTNDEEQGTEVKRVSKAKQQQENVAILPEAKTTSTSPSNSIRMEGRALQNGPQFIRPMQTVH
ncbi:hypothetical protein CEXT_633481 [Caerostris extrusa]|uniref:Uncharacterized protein n=1 Tax=Caerostris extrusa TaxID=172846 RepID=A0AAV4XU12_CAEEX|nr:hypothetical protein CEXT_633481 [Caerostris extrusa]